MYAILDIETTGGKYNEEGITEIAIYRFDGHTITDQFISLINPERPIQAFVVGLTGINNEMLRNAPRFYEVAKRIIEITESCIIVAHNAQFDYRVLSLEFDRLGYPFERQSLCTVELSQDLIPGHKSYSLGKLARALGIPVTDRHRANGDAMATVKLFKILLAKDTEKTIIQKAVRTIPKRTLDKKLRAILEEVPSSVGVYYMHNVNGTIIYIGKSKNIKKRLNQHFTSDNRKSKKIQDEIHAVTFEETGSELIALLKENEEIKRNRPKYNSALRRTKFKTQLVSYIDEKGYINLKTEKADPSSQAITTFSNTRSAKSFLEKVTESYQLCQNKVLHHKSNSACFDYNIKKCSGACIEEEPPSVYNDRAQQLINKYSYADKSFLIIDKGRTLDERSVVLIEEGFIKGIAFYNLNFQINNLDVLRTILNPMENNRDAQHIIQSYLRSRKVLRIIPFSDITH